MSCWSLFYSRETYNALSNWLTDARTLASPNIVIILCGNKKDLDADREVTFLEASRFAQENGNWSWTDLASHQSRNICLFADHILRFISPFDHHAVVFCPHRTDVSRNKCTDRGKRGGGFPEVCPHYPQQDRLRYTLVFVKEACLYRHKYLINLHF